MIYSGGSGSGMFFKVRYAEGLSEENPIVLAKVNSLSTLPMKTSRMGLGDKGDFLKGNLKVWC